MKKGSILRALVVSVLLSGVFPPAYMLSFVKGVEYDPPLDHSTLSQLSLNEQAKIVEKRAHPVSGLQFMISNSGHLDFWLWYGKLMVLGFIVAFVASVSVLFWEQKARTHL